MALEDIDGYPFLHLAQRHSLDYGDILLCSDSFIHSPLNVWEREARKRVPKEIQVEILKITAVEMKRKYPDNNFTAWEVHRYSGVLDLGINTKMPGAR